MYGGSVRILKVCMGSCTDNRGMYGDTKGMWSFP